MICLVACIDMFHISYATLLYETGGIKHAVCKNSHDQWIQPTTSDKDVLSRLQVVGNWCVTKLKKRLSINLKPTFLSARIVIIFIYHLRLYRLEAKRKAEWVALSWCFYNWREKARNVISRRRDRELFSKVPSCITRCMCSGTVALWRWLQFVV